MGDLLRFILYYTGDGEQTIPFEWETVTGTSPLALVNAVAKEIRALTQIGKCTSVDGDIYCNNGKMVVVHRSGLPRGYTLLDCVGGSGSQYVITDVYLASTDVIECEYRNSSTTGFGAIYGIYKSNESSALYGNRTYYGYTSANNKVDTDVAVDTEWHSSRHDFVNGTLTVDDTTVSFTPWEFANTTKNGVLTRYYNNSYGYNWNGYIRKFKVTRGNTIICNLLPCKNDQNVVGFYDLANSTFYAPTGGALIEGNEVDDYDFAIEGTAEVLTVGTQTASVADLFATDVVSDEHDIISGTVTRKTEVSVSNGVITIQALAEPIVVHVTPQRLRTSEGSNTVNVASEISNVSLRVEYAKATT